MKVSELTGSALNWAVAKSLGLDEETLDLITWECTAYPSGCYSYSTDWGQGGPIIEREKLDGFWNPETEHWSVSGWDERADIEARGWGETYLLAAMRCFVESKLGREIDVPKEIV